MLLPSPTLAFIFPSSIEWVMILGLGLLLFGRKLPEVGRSIGKTVRDLRRGFEGFKRELNADEDFREAKSALTDIKKAVDAPRKLANPKRILADMINAEKPETKPTNDESPHEGG